MVPWSSCLPFIAYHEVRPLFFVLFRWNKNNSNFLSVSKYQLKDRENNFHFYYLVRHNNKLKTELI